ncbi:BhlA/UviB family holin-like peptide [Enterocloster clostridioformis]|uniref:BhlA/UviB family holin-like peptide n=1 Tax=Enterocloster clostridioformis TaxID=1531 RepID=UPI00267451B1|nr:BhlA/UviB family holin-like peptide [Enterocloster clostridioformis]
MEELITQLIQSQGIWAVLFVLLLLYTIKKNDKLDELQNTREKEYQQLLLELSDKLTIVNEINSKLDNLYAQYTNGVKEQSQ